MIVAQYSKLDPLLSSCVSATLRLRASFGDFIATFRIAFFNYSYSPLRNTKYPTKEMSQSGMENCRASNSFIDIVNYEEENGASYEEGAIYIPVSFMGVLGF